MRTFRARVALVALGVALAVFLALPTMALAYSASDYPNVNSAGYLSPTNPFAASGYSGQCTWFVWGRTYEKLGIALGGSHGGAETWYGDLGLAGYTHNPTTPLANSIACWGGGHVAFIEEVIGSNVVLNEAHVNGVLGYYGQPETVAISAMQNRSPGSLQGYIYVGGTTPTPPAEGSFVQVSGSPAVYRIAGGAPLYVSSWSAVGGSKPVTVLSQAQFNALNAVPSNGTLVASSGDGRVYEIAGGAPLYVSSFAAIGGARAVIGIDQWDVDNITNPAAHLNAVPSNGTLVGDSADGRVYEVAGGAPLYVSNFAAIGGARPVVGIDVWDINNTSDPHAHLSAYPSNGTLVASSGDGRVYEIAGGAPLYVSSFAAIGGARSVVGIDVWDINNTSDSHAHLRAKPANGTFVNAHTAARVERGSFIIAGGAPIYISSWSIYGGQAPTGIVEMDAWDLDNTGDVHAHLNAKPVNGTLVRGMPSQSYWTFASGYRVAKSAGTGAVAVDDVGLASFPVYAAPTTAPTFSKLSPTSGSIGTIVTIIGRHFGSKRGPSVVRFGTNSATKYLSWSSTRIRVKVPHGTVKGRVKVVIRTLAGTSPSRRFTRK
jgi:surface antigen